MTNTDLINPIFFWQALMFLLFCIGFIYGYILGKDETKRQNEEKDLSKTDNEETDFPDKSNEATDFTVSQVDNKIETSTIIRNVVASLLSKFAVYTIKADRVTADGKILPTVISIFNYNDCGICIWDETLDDPKPLFDSCCVGVQLKPENELRIYPAGFSHYYLITETHDPPETLKEMGEKISRLANNYYA